MTPLDRLVIGYNRHPYSSQTVVPMLHLESSDRPRVDEIEGLAYHPHENTVTALCPTLGWLIFDAERVAVSAIGDVHVEYAS